MLYQYLKILIPFFKKTQSTILKRAISHLIANWNRK